MGQIKLANNAYTTLATGCTTSATALTVTASTTFPSVTTASGNWFYACLQDTFANLEIVKVTDVTGTTWTVTRGVGGTTGLAFPSGTVVELRVTAETLSDLLVLPGATISGGTINNTPIGGTTPSTGAFTTLSTTGAFLVAETQEIGWGVGTTGLIGSSAGNYARTYVGGTLRTEVNTTGLAVTGTLGVSGLTTLSGQYTSFNNNGYIRGDTANTMVFQPGTGGYLFRDSGNSTNWGVWTSTGLAVTGTLSATGASHGNLANFTGPSRSLEVFETANGTGISDLLNYNNIFFNTVTGATTFNTNNATVVTLDPAGNLGLGVTPSAWGVGNSVIQSASGNFFGVGGLTAGSNAYYNGGWKYVGAGYAALYQQVAGQYHAWSIAPSGTAGNPITFTQAMTLDANGNLLLNPIANGGITLQQAAGQSFQTIAHVTGTASGTSYSSFFYNGSVIGSITQSGTTAVLYNTTSDYRLKENVQPVTSALATIAQLNPVNFTWKADGRPDTGFIAHEFQAVIPNNVTGEKDAVDADGKPVYQQMDNSGAIPYLVKAIQELKAEFDAYKVTHQ